MIQSIQRAAAVLRAVSERDAPSFTDLREATGLKKATLSRILASLEDLDLVSRAPDRSYSMGPLVLELARPALRRKALSRVAERHCRALAEDLRELVTVGTIRQGRRCNLARATVERSIIVDAEPHLRPTPYNTATGRTMLAHISPEALDEVVRVSGLPGGEWPEVVTREELEDQLRRIRRAGYADYVSPDAEAEALAVPVFGPDGAVRAAVGVSAPRYRLDQERRTELLKALRKAADAMEQELALELGRARQEEKE